MTIKIGLVGDYAPQIAAHIAIPEALQLAAAEARCEIEESWLATEDTFENLQRLSDFAGLWCVPGSPYKSMDGALAAIRFARTRGVPFLGTCGGFQHAVIEYARNVLEFERADHAESNPKAEMLLMIGLTCSLVGAEGTIKFAENSRVRRIYSADVAIERYHCNFGFNPEYLHLFEAGEIKITGADAESGETRVVELATHPFFIATLFQPERSALRGERHPLISAFVKKPQILFTIKHEHRNRRIKKLPPRSEQNKNQ